MKKEEIDSIVEGDMIKLEGEVGIVFECLDGAVKAFPINPEDKTIIGSDMDCEIIKKRYDIDPDY